MPLLTKLTRGRFGAGALDIPGLSYRTLRVALMPTTGVAPVLTGLRLPPKSLVSNVYVDMRSVASSVTPLLDVGILTGAAATGFISGLNVASIGPRQGALASGAVTLGSLLQETVAVGVAVRLDFISSATAPTEITYNTRAAATRLEGTITIVYRVLLP